MVAACNQATPDLEGFSCSSDGDCNPGLKCLPYFGLNDGGLKDGALKAGSASDGGLAESGAGDAGSDAGLCFSSGMECLVPCHSDSDCRSPLVCFTACGTAACEAPGLMGVPAETHE